MEAAKGIAVNHFGYRIEAAARGGFIVSPVVPASSPAFPLFAGSLQDCLDFVKAQFETEPPVFDKENRPANI